MKRLTFVLISALVAVLSLSAAPLTVSWADGKVEKQKGSTWLAVNMGDQVDSADTLRLAKGASVELTDGKRKVSLTAAGSYQLDALLKQGATASKTKGAALDKLGKLVDPKASAGAATVAAVRGAAIEPTKESVAWASDSADVGAIMEEGRALVRSGDFVNAAAKFGDAAFSAEGDEKDAAVYAQAWSLAACDSSAQAVKLLRGMPSAGVWAGPRALLLARLDIDSGAQAEAKSVLDAALTANLLAGDDVDLAKSLITEAGK
jgi:hypothetical protein